MSEGVAALKQGLAGKDGACLGILANFRHRFPMSDQAFEALLVESPEVQHALLQDFSPRRVGGTDHTRLVLSVLKRLGGKDSSNRLPRSVKAENLPWASPPALRAWAQPGEAQLRSWPAPPREPSQSQRGGPQLSPQEPQGPDVVARRPESGREVLQAFLGNPDSAPSVPAPGTLSLADWSCPHELSGLSRGHSWAAEPPAGSDRSDGAAWLSYRLKCGPAGGLCCPGKLVGNAWPAALAMDLDEGECEHSTGCQAARCALLSLTSKLMLRLRSHGAVNEDVSGVADLSAQCRPCRALERSLLSVRGLFPRVRLTVGCAANTGDGCQGSGASSTAPGFQAAEEARSLAKPDSSSPSLELPTHEKLPGSTANAECSPEGGREAPSEPACSLGDAKVPPPDETVERGPNSLSEPCPGSRRARERLQFCPMDAQARVMRELCPSGLCPATKGNWDHSAGLVTRASSTAHQAMKLRECEDIFGGSDDPEVPLDTEARSQSSTAPSTQRDSNCEPEHGPDGAAGRRPALENVQVRSWSTPIGGVGAADPLARGAVTSAVAHGGSAKQDAPWADAAACEQAPVQAAVLGARPKQEEGRGPAPAPQDIDFAALSKRYPMQDFAADYLRAANRDVQERSVAELSKCPKASRRNADYSWEVIKIVKQMKIAQEEDKVRAFLRARKNKTENPGAREAEVTAEDEVRASLCAGENKTESPGAREAEATAEMAEGFLETHSFFGWARDLFTQAGADVQARVMREWCPHPSSARGARSGLLCSAIKRAQEQLGQPHDLEQGCGRGAVLSGPMGSAALPTS